MKQDELDQLESTHRQLTQQLATERELIKLEISKWQSTSTLLLNSFTKEESRQACLLDFQEECLVKKMKLKKDKEEQEWVFEQQGLDLKKRKLENRNMEAKTVFLKQMAVCGFHGDEVSLLLKHVLKKQ